MCRYILILIAILLVAVTAFAGETSSPPPAAPFNPPDRQRFEPVTPGLRIKEDRERVNELKRVPAPEETKNKTGPEKSLGGGGKNEK